MIKGCDKGNVHFHILGTLFAIAVIYLLVMTSVKPMADYPGGVKERDSRVDYYSIKTSSGKPYQPRVEDLHLNDMDGVLDSAVDIQVKLLYVQAEAVRMAWNSLDEKTQSEVMAAFVKDIQSQQDQVNRFLELYKSSKWVLLKSEARKEKVEELLRSINGQQKNILSFLKHIQAVKSDGSIEEK